MKKILIFIVQKGQKLPKFFPYPKFQPNVFQLSKLKIAIENFLDMTVSRRKKIFMTFLHILDQIEIEPTHILSP